MSDILHWLRDHKFEAHLIAFLLMVLPPVPLYFAARNGVVPWMWALLAPILLGNLLALVTK